MTDLLDALGAAKEGSGELDIAIHKLVCEPNSAPGTDHQYRVDCDGRGEWRYRSPGTKWALGGESGKRKDWSSWWHTEPYTTSIDAALQLVPEGRGWHISIYDDGEVVVNHVWVSGDGQRHEDHGYSDEGKTPALALCIAALKARKALRARAAHDSTEAE